jgi:hypothetical protein
MCAPHNQSGITHTHTHTHARYVSAVVVAVASLCFVLIIDECLAINNDSPSYCHRALARSLAHPPPGISTSGAAGFHFNSE